MRMILTIVLMILLVMVLVTRAEAETAVDVIGGAVTFHVIPDDAAEHYPNKITNDGRLVLTPLYGLRIIHFTEGIAYYSATYFEGQNCISSPIHGGLLSYGIDLDGLNLGFIGGGYVQNYHDFEAAGMAMHFTVGRDSNSFVPIAGLELNIREKFHNHWYWGINNILTPVLTNHSLFMGVEL